MNLSIKIKPFSFDLSKSLNTSQGVLTKKEGWLLNIHSSTGKTGWGEVAPINQLERETCKKILTNFKKNIAREILEKNIHSFPASLRFGLGAAFAEIDSLIDFEANQQKFKIHQTAFLLPTGPSLIPELESKLKLYWNPSERLTFKWKVAILPNEVEIQLLDEILNKLPPNTRLRIDANGGWSRKQANNWTNYLINEKKLEYIEQPLHSDDIEGLTELSQKIPIALDESLLKNPDLREEWNDWQIRKPLLEGDPRILLQELREKVSFRVISTSFETGIGKRWIEYLAILQQQGPTPTAPGLGVGWCPESKLFSDIPQLVWEAA